jgi:cytochrome P450
MREKYRVAYSELYGWSIFRHADVVRVLRDHETFSNAVSQHLSVPNGMDLPEHAEYRRVIEPYFAPERMLAFRPACRDIAADLVRAALVGGEVEIMSRLGRPFAGRVQCAFLGWPQLQAPALVQWTLDNQAATEAGDRTALSNLARHFEKIIDEQLDRRGDAESQPSEDLTAALMNEQVWGRPLSNEEIASILRNWTGGEIATIAAALGILVHFLAMHEELQDQLRHQPSLISTAIDEILRIDGPLAVNRRVTTSAVDLGDRVIGAGERLSLMWISANRDPRVFPDPDEFRWDRDPKLNLLYGDGIHVCPGAPLARLELTTFVEELLQRTQLIRLTANRTPTRAAYPASGFSEVFAQFQ